jgi:hypothetical protein
MSSDQILPTPENRIEPKPFHGSTRTSGIVGFVIALLSFIAATGLNSALAVTSQFAPEVIVVRCSTGFINLGVAALLVTAPFLNAWRWRNLWRAAAVMIPLLFLFVAAINRTFMQFPNGKRVFAYESMFPDLFACVVICLVVIRVVTWIRPTFVYSASEARTIGFDSGRFGLMPLTIVAAVALTTAAMLSIWVWSSESAIRLEQLTPFVSAPAEPLLFLAGFLGGVSRFRQYPMVIAGVAMFVLLNAVAFSMALSWSNPFIMVVWLIVGIPFDLVVTLVVGLVLGFMMPTSPIGQPPSARSRPK